MKQNTERNHTMSEHESPETGNPPEPRDALGDRRKFLGDLGKWSAASLAAVTGGAAWLSTSGSARAASWINRRHGGGWVNGGGSWVNRGGGGWVNRRGGGGSDILTSAGKTVVAR